MSGLRFLVPVFLFLWILRSGAVFAGEAETAGGISLKFHRADLAEVVRFFGQHLKLSYSIDPEVRGVVSASSAGPLRKEDLLPVLQQILRLNGAAAVEGANGYRIVPLKEGRRVLQGGQDGYALWVGAVRFFPSGRMKSLLLPFLGLGGEILDQPRGNLLFVIDMPPNIKRLAEIQALLDVEPFAAMRLEIYQAKAASAEELAAEMAKITPVYGPSIAPEDEFAIQFFPIPGGEQLLIIGRPSEAIWSFAKGWLRRLDTVSSGPSRKLFIYPVKNGRATEWAQRLAGDKNREPLRVVPDPVTNSLIIYGTSRELQHVKQLLQEDGTQEFKERLLSAAQQIASGKKRRMSVQAVSP